MYFSVIFDLSSSFSAVGESVVIFLVTIAAVGSLLAEIIVPASLQLQIMLHSASYLVAFLNVDFLPCVILFISSVLAYSFLRISLVRLSMSFSWITVQSVVHMWYCRVGKAKLLVARVLFLVWRYCLTK